VNNPELYEFLTWAAGLALQVHPGLYKFWIAFEKFKSRYLWGQKDIKTLAAAIEGAPLSRIPGEHPAFREAALELSHRGFDSIVFGHTHHAGEVVLETGARYYNSGSWLMGTPFISIDHGRVSVERWSRTWEPRVLPVCIDDGASASHSASAATTTSGTGAA
jgi:hypothetical protein